MKMIFHRILPLFLPLVLFGLTGCGKSTIESPPEESASAAVVWPNLELIHALSKEMLAQDNMDTLAPAWAKIKVLTTDLLENMPTGAMNPLAAKSSAGQAIGLTMQEDPLSKEKIQRFHDAIVATGKSAGITLGGHDHGHDHGHGHGHGHPGEGPHHGVKSPLLDSSGSIVAWIEVKLHGDKNDLEAWVCEDAKLQTASPLPLDTEVVLSYVVGGDIVTLTVRDTETNQDEDGFPTIVDGHTNYFIGAEGREGVMVASISMGEKEWKTELFELVNAHDHAHHH